MSIHFEFEHLRFHTTRDGNFVLRGYSACDEERTESQPVRDASSRETTLAFYEAWAGFRLPAALRSDAEALLAVRLPPPAYVRQVVAQFAAQISLNLSERLRADPLQRVPGFADDGYFYGPFGGFCGWTDWVASVAADLLGRLIATAHVVGIGRDLVDLIDLLENTADALLDEAFDTRRRPTADAVEVILRDRVYEAVEIARAEEAETDRPVPFEGYRIVRHDVHWQLCGTRRGGTVSEFIFARPTREELVELCESMFGCRLTVPEDPRAPVEFGQ